LPFLIDLIVQEVLVFAIVHVLPPKETLEPVIFEPPFDVGNVMVTFTFTLPSFGVEEEMLLIVGADGFVIFTVANIALAGEAAAPVTSEMVVSSTRTLCIFKAHFVWDHQQRTNSWRVRSHSKGN
jgi:hypothetical protein